MDHHRIDRGRSDWLRKVGRRGGAGRSRMHRRTFVLERLEERVVMSSTWVSQGPGPIINGGNVEGITSPDGSRPEAGATEALAASPTDANLVYAGTVNGGVWKTTNATAATPIWTNLTDFTLPAQSIDSLALSPLDATGNTVFAGTGSTSSYQFDGSPGFGVARTTDGGTTWSVLAQSTFFNRIINSVVPTSITTDGTINTQVVLASTLFDGGGVFRSTDGGTSFTQISGSHGLPTGGVSSLVADPTNANRFYAAVPAAFVAGGAANAGVYLSTDGGANWTQTTPLPSGLSTSLRILLSVGRTTGDLYAMEINTSGTLSAVFRSPDQGTTWTSMGVPSPPIFPGAQGIVHGAIVADPTDANVVFISGDRQNSPFPNVNGANTFSMNAFRGVFSANGTTWQNIVDNGNGGGANGTSPHPDSRAMVFDANGNILQGNDGGIYRLANPNNASTRIWQSVEGNITPTEAHSAAFDSFSGVFFSGNQDNGTSIQPAPGGHTWFEFISGDGGNVAVDDSAATTASGTSIRYTSFTFLQSFNRSKWDSANNFLSFSFVGLNIVAGPGAGQNLLNFDKTLEFYQPYVLNTVDATRMLIGTQNIYESTNQGDSLANLGSAGGQVGSFFQNSGNPGMVYGGHDPGGAANLGLFYVAANNPTTGAPTIDYRPSFGSPITTLTLPTGMATIEALTVDPQNDTHVYVLDQNQQVWSSFNSGSTWTNLTANLDTIGNLGTGTDLRTIEIFSPSASPLNTVLIVGGQGGVWQMRRPGAAGTSWTTLATGFPHALVYDLHYDYTDNVLTAGTLGRGVWSLTDFFRGGGGTGISGATGLPGGTTPIVPVSLDLLLPSVFKPATIAPLQFSSGSGVLDNSGGSGVVNNGGTPVGTQALTASTSGAAFQGPSLSVSNLVIGRSLVNQAVDDGDPDSFGLL